MINPDIINGLFEFISGLFMLTNIIKLVKDKTVKGYNWYSVVFFSFWGGWNLFYYPSLDQYFSFIAGIFLFLINIIWVGTVWYYKIREKKLKEIKHKEALNIANRLVEHFSKE